MPIFVLLMVLSPLAWAMWTWDQLVALAGAALHVLRICVYAARSLVRRKRPGLTPK